MGGGGTIAGGGIVVCLTVVGCLGGAPAAAAGGAVAVLGAYSTINGVEKARRNANFAQRASGYDDPSRSAYPEVTDPRTGKNIPEPIGRIDRVDSSKRVDWGRNERGQYIKEWHDRGYSTPDGGWDKYDVHHIKPREFGGDNDFWNLVPVRKTEHELFNAFWREYP
jgi:hypothetical protein